MTNTVVIRATRKDGYSPFIRGARALLTPERGEFNPGVPWFACLSLREARLWFLFDDENVRWSLAVCGQAQVRRDTRISYEARVHGPAIVVWSGDASGLQALAGGRPLHSFARRQTAWARIRRAALRMADRSAA